MNALKKRAEKAVKDSMTVIAYYSAEDFKID